MCPPCKREAQGRRRVQVISRWSPSGNRNGQKVGFCSHYVEGILASRMILIHHLDLFSARRLDFVNDVPDLVSTGDFMPSVKKDNSKAFDMISLRDTATSDRTVHAFQVSNSGLSNELPFNLFKSEMAKVVECVWSKPTKYATLRHFAQKADITVLQGFTTRSCILDKKFGDYHPKVKAWDQDDSVSFCLRGLVGKISENDIRAAIPASNLQPRNIVISDFNYTTSRDTMVAIVSEMCRQLGQVKQIATRPGSTRSVRET